MSAQAIQRFAFRLAIAAIVTTALLTACDTSVDPPSTLPFCGNRVCDGGENPCACPQDCGSAPSTEAGHCSDEVDNDCDGLVDENDSDCYWCGWYRDADGDGYGDPGDSILSQTQPSGYVLNFGDCDDSCATCYPGGTETCDGKDNNCNQQTDEEGATGCTTYYRDHDNDTYGLSNDHKCLCAASGEYRATRGGDCDDNCVTCHPGGTETCDGKDNDCNQQTDEEGATGCTTYYRDHDNDTYGLSNDHNCLCAANGEYRATRGGDCDDNCATCYPGGTETCDGKDNNCNQQTDEEGATGCTTYYRDHDNDTYGLSNDHKCLCAASGEYRATRGGDCDDNCDTCYPGGSEVCDDGVDNDCDDAADCDDSDCLVDCGTIYITAAAGEVMKASLDGTDLETFADVGDGYGFGASGDANGQTLYVIVKGNTMTSLWKLMTSGGIPQVLWSASNSTMAPFDVAFSPANTRLYWTASIEDSVNRCTTDGTMELTEYGEDQAQGVAAAAGYVFWCRKSTTPTLWHIKRSDLSFGSEVTIVGNLSDQVKHLAIDIAGQRLYWTDSSNSIWSATVDGADKRRILLSEGNPVGIAVHSTAGKVYWAEQGPDRIRRANLDGTSIENLITTGVTAPHDIVLVTPTP